MTARDPSFSDTAAYGSNAWAAARLGLTKDTFFRKRKDLEEQGFPKRDPLTNLYLKDDVEAWLDRRRKIVNETVISVAGPNLDGI